MIKGPVLILGGSSDIGVDVANRFAKGGFSVQLAGRRPDELEPTRRDIALRHGVEVTVHHFDALDVHSHEDFVSNLPVLPQIAVCAVGLLGKQEVSQRDTQSAVLVMRSNFEGPASILGVLANYFEKRGSGTLVGISSVAGDRGRSSNYVYGSAKAGFTAFLSGLRARLARTGVHVVTVKPGFVYTRMTEDMQLPSALTVRSETVAASIYRAVSKSRDIIYVGSYWRLLILLIRLIPERLFKFMQI